MPLETMIAPPAVTTTSGEPTPTFDAELMRILDGAGTMDITEAVAETKEEKAAREAAEAQTEEERLAAEAVARENETEEDKAAREAAEAKAEEERLAAEEEERKQQEDPERVEWPQSAQKRVDKLTALKGEAERERDGLKTQVETLTRERDEALTKHPAPTLASTPENPLAHVMKTEDLSAQVQFSQTIQDWAIEHAATGGTLPPEIDRLITGRSSEDVQKEPSELTPAEVGKLLKIANQRLSRDIPNRAHYLRTDTQAEGYVKEHYPQMLKPDSEEGKLYAQFERQFPQIKLLPTWRVALVDLVRGTMSRLAEEKERGTKPADPKGAAPKVPVKPKPTALAPVPPGAPRGAGATPKVAKPQTAPKLSASMDANELADALP